MSTDAMQTTDVDPAAVDWERVFREHAGAVDGTLGLLDRVEAVQACLPEVTSEADAEALIGDAVESGILDSDGDEISLAGVEPDEPEGVDEQTLLDELRAEREARKEVQAELRREREAREALEERVGDLEDTVDFLTEEVLTHDEILTGDAYDTATAHNIATNNGGVVSWLEATGFDDETIQDVLAVDERITKEQKTRSQQDTKIRRELNKLADEVGVDLEDAEVSGEDKIQRLIVHGPDDVTDRVYDVHERAREVLLHAGEWGRVASDQFGKRITLTSPTVRENLEMVRNESLQSKQVRDVFQKIVELAEDSPRKARTGKTDDGVNKLLIHLDQEEM